MATSWTVLCLTRGATGTRILAVRKIINVYNETFTFLGNHGSDSE